MRRNPLRVVPPGANTTLEQLFRRLRDYQGEVAALVPQERHEEHVVIAQRFLADVVAIIQSDMT